MGAHKGLLVHENESHFADAIKWAKVFWGANVIASIMEDEGSLTPDK